MIIILTGGEEEDDVGVEWDSCSTLVVLSEEESSSPLCPLLSSEVTAADLEELEPGWSSPRPPSWAKHLTTRRRRDAHPHKTQPFRIIHGRRPQVATGRDIGRSGSKQAPKEEEEGMNVRQDIFSYTQKRRLLCSLLELNSNSTGYDWKFAGERVTKASLFESEDSSLLFSVVE